MGKKWISFILLQVFVLSSFGVSMHACFCCTEDTFTVNNQEISHLECSLPSSEEKETSDNCSLCLSDSSNQEASQSHKNHQNGSCDCAGPLMEPGSECNKTSIEVSTDSEENYLPLQQKSLFENISQEIDLPILLSYYLFADLIHSDLKFEQENEFISLVTPKISLNIQNCIFRI